VHPSDGIGISIGGVQGGSESRVQLSPDGTRDLRQQTPGRRSGEDEVVEHDDVEMSQPSDFSVVAKQVEVRQSQSPREKRLGGRENEDQRRVGDDRRQRSVVGFGSDGSDAWDVMKADYRRPHHVKDDDDLDDGTDGSKDGGG